MTSANTKKNKSEVQTQGEPHEFSEHSLESLDPMRSIRNLHMQQWQKQLHNEVPQENPSTPLNIISQEPNLITFIPPPRRRKTKSEWPLNQKQFAPEPFANLTHLTKGAS